MSSYLAPQETHSIISKDYISGITVSTIAKKYNCTISNIYRILHKENVKIRSNNINKRIYEVNHNFFDCVDTEEKAYILGFLYADGYNDIKSRTVKLVLHKEDKMVLEKISKFIQPTKPLYFLNHQRRRDNGSNVSDCYSLSISSKHICNQLDVLGCFQAKTFNLKFPTEKQVPNHLINHFIRGYFDGDGCIKISRDSKKQSFSLVGTEEFLYGVQKVLIKNLNLPNTKLYKPTTQTHNNICVLSHSSLNSCLNIRNYLYFNATIYLQRKYDKFNNINFKN